MDTVSNNGATYHGDLTKVVTHLIAAVPQGAKYIRAKQWGVKVVSSKWLRDSMKRGMALDESLYDPVLPEDEQGRGAYIKAVERTNTPAKRARDGSAASAAAEDARKRKVRRTASVRLASQSQSLWTDMSLADTNDTGLDAGQWEDRPAAVESPGPVPAENAAPVKNEEPAMPQTLRMESPKMYEQPPGLFTGWACHATGHEQKEVSRFTMSKRGHYLTVAGINHP